MGIKKFLKFVVYFLLSLIIIYAIVFFSFGGPGKKNVTDLAKDNGYSMLLFAHRGVLNYYPEHSVEGAEAAKQLGFNAIEIDIRKTAEDELIVFHDETAARMLGIDKPVESMTLAEIQKQWLIFRNAKTNNRVLTVDEFLSRYKNNFFIYCDMKITSFSDCEKLVALIKKNHAEKKCIMASAGFTIIEYLEMKHPAMITALEGFDSGKEWSYYIMPKNLRPDYFSGFFQKVDQNQINWLNKKRLLSQRIVYGVESSNFNKAKSMGIKNIIMDYDSSMGKIEIGYTP
jgi:glycerophosphoryl diester phosphodiesterase